MRSVLSIGFLLLAGCAPLLPGPDERPRAAAESVLLAAPLGADPERVPLRAPPAHVTLTVTTTLRPARDGTRVRTRVSAAPMEGDASRPGAEAHCVTTGRLERRIVEELRELAPARARL